MIPSASSDHSLVFCVIKADVTKAPPHIIEYRSHKRYNKEFFLQDRRKNNWSAAVGENDINATVDNWYKRFTDIADLHAPIKKMKVKGVNIHDSRAKSGNATTRPSSKEGTKNPVKNTLACIPQIPLLRKQKSA